ncbi:glycine cleavage system aminomethyltransferase GcvT [Halomarina oriensis]|uniref:Probable aminomethyltransferase n=1 Tax=Halomarina oriensis TaxID=671145 RepID=A0A6B0GVQ6_9EURY|nr:glycine cleavage system aminomethyltransferase GcvT [Halomarina oriensis]MWG35788.1 glycine cleavage system aminomethyltransferase GcvT [Halomarina oriensis]
MALRMPPLRERHAERGATFTEFGGWEMPVEFDSIRTEHTAVREAAGVFDVSHMGEIRVGGPDALELMQRLTTNDVTRLSPGEGQYSAVVDDRGVVLDDTVVYDLPEEAGYLFVPNAGHDVRMYERWTDHREEWGLDATVEDATEEYGMFAVQGPDAEALLADAADESVRDVGRFEIATTTVADVPVLAARTGYTGEDGFEILCPADESKAVWSAFDCQPCGLGARDTLRIEHGFLLSGQDFDPEDEPRTPYEAGIGFVVKLDAEPAFVGRDTLAEGTDPEMRFVGVELLDRGVPRHGYDVADDGEVIGHLTSGTMSPTLDRPVGLGYVPAEYADPGTRVQVVVRGKHKQARISDTPFQ